MVGKSASRLRRRLQPQARRLEILTAAERLLRERGEAVRVDDVVAEAGAAKGTFYHYFPLWDDLLETLRAGVLAGFADRYRPPTPGAGREAWAQTLSDLVEAFVDFTLSQRRLHGVLFHSDFARRRPLSPQLGAVGRLEALIRAGEAAGAYSAIDPPTSARLLFAVLHEAADLVAEGAERGPTLATAASLLRRALDCQENR